MGTVEGSHHLGKPAEQSVVTTNKLRNADLGGLDRDMTIRSVRNGGTRRASLDRLGRADADLGLSSVWHGLHWLLSTGGFCRQGNHTRERFQIDT